MEIIINKVENKKEGLDESFGILNSYKKIIRKPHSKILKRSTKLKVILIFILIYIAFVIWCLASRPMNSMNLYFVCFGIASMALVLVLASFIKYIKYLNFNANRETNSIFKINEEKIELENKVLKANYITNWEDVKLVLITDRNIAFLPGEEKIKNTYVIMIPRMYEKEVKETMEKYNKSDLIVYNKK